MDGSGDARLARQRATVTVKNRLKEKMKGQEEKGAYRIETMEMADAGDMWGVCFAGSMGGICSSFLG
ncbi:hypothetical protein NL676_034887 [Syzygium grande]|nr:hypothetical protein NL676_034887 [Syzygium grande]